MSEKLNNALFKVYDLAKATQKRNIKLLCKNIDMEAKSVANREYFNKKLGFNYFSHLNLDLDFSLNLFDNTKFNSAIKKVTKTYLFF